MQADSVRVDAVTVVRGEREVVRQVSLHAQAGELLAVVGPNGAGKSSLLKAVAGLWPCRGQIQVGDKLLAAMTPRERAHSLGYVPQRSALTEGVAVRDVVAQARYAHRPHFLGFAEHIDPVVERALARVGLLPLAARAYDTLSGGEQRRVLMARAIASEARVLLLDEPTAGLDVAQVLRLFTLLSELRREGYALVCVLHDLQDVLRYADSALLMHQGRAVAHGKAAEVLSAERVRQVYGVHSHENAALGFSLHGAYS